jgi:hypothetical protein
MTSKATICTAKAQECQQRAEAADQGASFNLEAVKEELDRKMANQAAR